MSGAESVCETHCAHWVDGLEVCCTCGVTMDSEGGSVRSMLLWKQTRNGGQAPRRGNLEDAGWDLVACETTRIEAGSWGNVPIGIAIEIPFDTWGMITGRSSTLAVKKLLVPMSVIDSGYRGELFVFAWNMNDEATIVEKGTRIGQLILMGRVDHARSVRWAECETLSESQRGEGGFGSTGK